MNSFDFLKYRFYFEVDSVQSMSYKAQRRLLHSIHEKTLFPNLSVAMFLALPAVNLAMPEDLLNKRCEYTNIK